MSSEEHVSSARAVYEVAGPTYVQFAGTDINSATEHPIDRTLLGAFVELIKRQPLRRVADVGCGPGRVAALMADQGLSVLGVDVSRAMLEIARVAHPRIEFVGGQLDALPIESGALAGAACWYSIIYTPQSRLVEAFEELARVLIPGGCLLLAFQEGGQPVHRDDAFGSGLPLTSYRHSLSDVVGHLEESGFRISATVVRAPELEHETTSQGFVVAVLDSPDTRWSFDLPYVTGGALPTRIPISVFDRHNQSGMRGTVSEVRKESAVDQKSGDIRVRVAERVMLITIDRSHKRNALTQAMYQTLADELLEADSDRDIGAVVLTGVGDVFTAGNDLTDFASGGSLDETVRFLEAISSVRVPLIAAVNGLAIGVGLTLLLHCDLVYVEPTADLSAPFVELGLVPEAASSLLLPRVIGERRAADLLLTGRHLTGSTAAEWGLANGAVSPVLDFAMSAAARVAGLPPLASRASKTLLRSEERTVRGRMSEEMAAFVEALGGTEFADVMAKRSVRR